MALRLYRNFAVSGRTLSLLLTVIVIRSAAVSVVVESDSQRYDLEQEKEEQDVLLLRTTRTRRRLAPPSCGDTTCRRECGGKCSAAEFDPSCCSQCPSLCDGGGPATDPPASCSRDGETCKGIPCCDGHICENLGRGVKNCRAVVSSPSTPAPSSAPTSAPSSAPGPTYSYIRSNSDGNVQGPDPTAANTVLKFYAIGDTPYDQNSDACLDAITGEVVDPCPYYDCGPSFVENCGDLCIDPDNTCVYQGSDYDCLQSTIIPNYLDASQAIFVGHVGDILKGYGGGNHLRCTQASFASRKNLFGALEDPASGNNVDILDFFLIPGDNDWNECFGFEPSNNNDPIKTMWREHFADATTSPFSGFDRINLPYIGTAPTVERNPVKSEIYFFLADNTAFFGINEPANSVATMADTDQANADWITSKLAAVGSCVSSIVILGHDDNISGNAQSEVRAALNAYYNSSCGPVPTLYVAGDGHPTKYRLQFQQTGFPVDTVLQLTVEAFEAGPLLVAIVQDPTTGYHFFHVQDTDEPTNPNDVCP